MKRCHRADAQSGRRCNHGCEGTHGALLGRVMKSHEGGAGRDHGDTLREVVDTTAGKAQESKDTLLDKIG